MVADISQYQRKAFQKKQFITKIETPLFALVYAADKQGLHNRGRKLCELPIYQMYF